MEVGIVKLTLSKHSKLKLGEPIAITIDNKKTDYVLSKLIYLDDDKLQLVLSLENSPF